MIAQDFRCAICRKRLKTRTDVHVDHDHECCGPTSQRGGKKTCGDCNRGFLCPDCNHMLGSGKDDPATLEAGAQYLLRWFSRADDY